MHAMIDLHNSSKYKVAYTFNKEDSKTPSNTGSEIQLEVQDCRTAGLQDCRYSNPTLSNAPSRQLV